MIDLVAAVLVGGGLATVVVALLGRARARDADLLRLLDVDEAPDPTAVADASTRLGLLRPVATAAGALLERVDRDRSIAGRLERAAVPLRPGEYAVGVGTVGVLAAGWVWAATDLLLFAVAPLVGAPAIGAFWLDRKVAARRRALERQLPDLLAGLAASVRGGHPLLRATALLAEEAPEPTASELQRVLAETQLGVPVVDAFERLADRVELEELSWVVEAIRIQQRVGGQLAELLFTLAAHLREREEIRREVQVLTAEGRLSTWLLSGLPIGMALVISIVSPGYLDGLTSGVGLLLLAAAVVGIVLGGVTISRMVRKVVL